jgi:hypothetical protein
MKTKQISFLRLSCAALLLAGFVTQLMPPLNVSAAQITARKVTLQTGIDGADANTIPDGGSQPGGNANHLLSFTLPTQAAGTGDDVGSIKFQYCTTAAPVVGGVGCIAPTGIDVNGVTLGTETGVTGFNGMTKVNDDDDTGSAVPLNTVIINKAAAADIGSPNTAVTYRLDGVINPSTPQTFFIRVSTHGSLDGTGAVIDSGTVAAATSRQIELTGTMPESLVFCAGQTVGLNGGGVPDCSTVTTGAVSFDALFSPTNTSTATSQMAASTNAGAGYAITVNGATMSSGSNQITAMNNAGSPTSLILGTSQFGMNLVENTTTFNNATPTPAELGTDIAPVSNGTNYRGQPVANYGTDDQFKFVSGDEVANSYSGGAGGTDAQIYTVGYVVNVPGSQPAGTYTTTLTYVCTPTF